MRKGVNALEIVFGMFLLIIVVFIVIRLTTTFVRPEKVSAPLQSFEASTQYNDELGKCKNLCENYNANNCNRRDAVNYCLQKVKLDIDGNSIPGEKGHGNFVRNLPYCEDGLYCFHINDCYCGSYKLDKQECMKILCDYYAYDEGLYDGTSQDTAINSISAIMNLIVFNKDGIYPGTCSKDPSKWNLGYRPQTTLYADWWAASEPDSDGVCTNFYCIKNKNANRDTERYYSISEILSSHEEATKKSFVVNQCGLEILSS